jgi:hypothetical protein
MNRVLLAAVALAALATPAYAEFGTKTEPCSIAERGHRASFKACAINWSMAFGHATYGVKTPNGRQFGIQNDVNIQSSPDHVPQWTLDGKPAKRTDGCYENRRVTVCFEVMFP